MTPLGPPREGSFSRIWKVRDVSNGRILAFKRLRPEWRNDRKALRCLQNEIHVAASVASRHVVRLERWDGGLSEASALLEWIDGETLDERLQRQNRFPFGEAVWIVRQAAQGLADLARAGFSHGDVKPANLMVGAEGHLTLIDLGFARPLSPSAREPSADTGCVTGTPEYMAPEVLSREPHNPLAADVYSLGVILYRLLSGRLPFRSESAESVLRQHRSLRPPPIEEVCPAVPSALSGLLKRMLAKHPVRRPQPYHALLRELLALELGTLAERFCA